MGGTMSSLLGGFADSVQNVPHRTALHLNGQRWTYQQLSGQSGRIAGAIAEGGLSQHRLVGLMASESLTAYAGVLAILAAGRGFVPIDPAYPPRQIEAIVDHAGIDTLVVGVEALDRLDNLLHSVRRPLAIIAPEADGQLRGLTARHRRHRYQTASDMPARCWPVVSTTAPQSTAYLSYTSGSTGVRRGVPVSHANVCAYLDAVDERFSVTPEDRCSHTFPLTFDLSIHDMFTTWSNGAALVAWSSSRQMTPAQFIRRHRLTRWFSVPTMAMAMKRRGELGDNNLGSLRRTLFCGEPLPASVATAWSQAAPDSSIINLYGPTEATIAVTSHRFRPGDVEQYRRGVVSLGEPFDDQTVCVVDDAGRPVGPGGRGELWISGPQVTDGYWSSPEETSRHFVERAVDGPARTWFRTGDCVERDEQGRLHFVGRLDEQIKLGGHHVELPEVDRVLRQACGHELACAVGWPRDDTGVYGLVGLVATDEPIDDCRLLADCRRKLPHSMVPDRLIGIDELPTNHRGKLDRQAMQQLLEHREVLT